MKILFLTRVHPPIVGGLENQSYNLVNNFKKINDETYTIINRGGKKMLPLFVPYSFLRALWLIWTKKITHLHLSDGVLAPVGLWLKRLSGVKVIATIHGLDVTYKNLAFRMINLRAINKLDKLICISENTRQECLKRGISKDKIVIVPNGVDTEEFVLSGSKKELRKKLKKKIGIQFRERKILVTTGRLVKRKGVAWFVDNVMPKLGEDYVYLISGDGPMREEIEKAFIKNKLDNVFLLGRTDNYTMKLLYNSADLFIMPNVSIPGDVEGFGLVAVEAGSCGLPVVAAKVDGIPNAIIDGKTGWLVRERDVKGFLKRIKSGKLDRDKVRAEVKKNFDWKNIVKRYKKVFEEVRG